MGLGLPEQANDIFVFLSHPVQGLREVALRWELVFGF